MSGPSTSGVTSSSVSPSSASITTVPPPLPPRKPSIRQFPPPGTFAAPVTAPSSPTVTLVQRQSTSSSSPHSHVNSLSSDGSSLSQLQSLSSLTTDATNISVGTTAGTSIRINKGSQLSHFRSYIRRRFSSDATNGDDTGSGASTTSVLVSPRTARMPFSKLLQCHQSIHLKLQSIDSELNHYHSSIMASHSHWKRVGLTVHSLLNDQSTQSPLTSVSKSFYQYTQQSYRLASSTLQHRLDNVILPTLQSKLRECEVIVLLVEEDAAKWKRFEHYSTKVSQLNVDVDRALKDKGSIPYDLHEKNQRNVAKLNGAKIAYDRVHGELCQKLQLFYELKDSFIDGLLVEVVKMTGCYQSSMHQCLAPVSAKMKEILQSELNASHHSQGSGSVNENENVESFVEDGTVIHDRRDRRIAINRTPPININVNNTEHDDGVSLIAPSHLLLNNLSSLSLPFTHSLSLQSNYQIIDRLGSGAYGSTVLCIDSNATSNDADSDSRVMYVMKRIECRRGRELNRAMREALMMSKVSDRPHLVKVREVYIEDNIEGDGDYADTEIESVDNKSSVRVTLCIVMDYYDTGDLQRRISIESSKRARQSFSALQSPSHSVVDSTISHSSNDGNSVVESLSSALNENQILLWLCQLCQGLSCLHSAAIIHRDIKPANLFLDNDDELFVGDFGVARLLLHSEDRAGTQIGTLQYLAPEMFGGSYDSKVDVWSAGCVLYELCTFQPPSFTFRSVTAIIQQCRDRGYSEALCTLLTDMLTVEPAQRPSADECVARIQSILSIGVHQGEKSSH